MRTNGLLQRIFDATPDRARVNRSSFRPAAALALLFALATVLTACTGPSRTRSRDGYPSRDIDVSKIPDAVPKYEPIGKAGNKSPYTVLGKTYRILPTSEGYRERGIASWYGTKFHGERTSNGEIYDMYAMTGAHKTLPIPCYVRVTNLDNRRSVIVRINDRGPFYSDRIIDLSYAAAKKLGFSNTGTARVEVAAITPGRYQSNPVENPHIDESPLAKNVKAEPPARNSAEKPVTGNAYLQAGAFRSKQSAESLRQKLSQMSDYPTIIKQSGNSGRALFKVLIGPIRNNPDVVELRNKLEHAVNLKAFITYDSR